MTRFNGTVQVLAARSFRFEATSSLDYLTGSPGKVFGRGTQTDTTEGISKPVRGIEPRINSPGRSGSMLLLVVLLSILCLWVSVRRSLCSIEAC
jgi:hypothetical protein